LSEHHRKNREAASVASPEGLESPAKPVLQDDVKPAVVEPQFNFGWVVDAVLCAFQAQFESFRVLLAAYVNTLSVTNAWGVTSTIDMCRLCSGGGIHGITCGCPCHPARKLLAQIDASKQTGKIISIR
jgi:hypothetical protein